MERHRQPRAVHKYWAQLTCARLCDHARQVPAVFAGQWMVPLFSSSTERWILPFCSETLTHSVKLCILDWIDMPVVVHVKAVDNPVMAQRPFPLVPCTRPQSFPSCSLLIRCSMSLLRRFSRFSGAGCEETVEIPQLHPLKLDTVVHSPLCNDSRRMVQTPENCAGSAVAV